jgi:hypothetical protein
MYPLSGAHPEGGRARALTGLDQRANAQGLSSGACSGCAVPSTIWTVLA